MNVLGIIPARGNSKSIKNKNLISFFGKPLIHYTLEAAIKSKVMNRIVVSSDSNKILNYASKKKNITTIKRPKKISRDFSPTIDSIRHTVRYLNQKFDYDPKYIIILQPTSPLRNNLDIRNAYKLFIKKINKADTLVSVQRIPHNFEPYSQMMIDKKGYLKSFFNQKKILTNRKKKKTDFCKKWSFNLHN